MAILGALTLALGLLSAFVKGPDIQPASNIELLASEQRLRQHLDEVEIRRSTFDERVERLPPIPRILLGHAGTDRALIWKVVAPFADEDSIPQDVAREWAWSAPATSDTLPPIGRIVVAELLFAYDQPVSAVKHLRAAIDGGVSPRAYWLLRVAQILDAQGVDREIFNRLLDEAGDVDPDYPLVPALKECAEGEWNRAFVTLEGWQARTSWEQETTLAIRAAALVGMQRLDDAISVLDSGPTESYSAGLLLRLAHLLRERAARGTGDSRFADATRAMETAIRARNMRRLWRTDSAEAVVAAAEAALLADDGPQVWLLTRPAPDGQASQAEAADPRVLSLAAAGAVLTGRVAQTQELLDAAPQGYARRVIEAELATADVSESGTSAAVDAWRAALAAANTDEETIGALRGLAMEGATDQDVLDDLRQRYPEAVADIVTIHAIASLSGPDLDERLREFEGKNALASVRRAELIRQDSPEDAAELLIEANDRWRNPRLLMMAMSCYQDAGLWDKAEQIGHAALVRIGTQRSGRITVLRRLAEIQSAQQKWTSVETTCRALLEMDQNDDVSRWILAHAQYRGGDPQQAWQTLHRAAALPSPQNPVQARLLLDLTRRYAGAENVGRTALTLIRSFSGDQSVYAAAIMAVELRVDRTELSNKLSSDMADLWREFMERYPDNQYFVAYQIRDGDNPLADIVALMRDRETRYRDVLNDIRNENRPLGVLESVTGRPYSVLLLHRPLGYHRMRFPGLQENAVELEYARASLSGRCIVDPSALYTLSLLPDVVSAVTGLLFRPAVTDSALRDLVAADDAFSLPGDGTLHYDAESGQIGALAVNADVLSRQQRQIQAMLSMARSFHRVIHPSVVHLASMSPLAEPTWWLILDAAKHTELPLWADDTGLRVVAHAMGIKTFSTYALLMLARERDRLDDATVSEISLQLIRECTIDLPYNQEALLAVAAEQNWEPRSIALILSLASSWRSSMNVLELFRAIFYRSPEGGLLSWASAAIQGILGLINPSQQDQALVAFLVGTFGYPATRPEHAAAVVEAVDRILPESSSHVVHGALERFWEMLSDASSAEKATTPYLEIISGLSDQYRQYGVHVILVGRAPRSGSGG